MRLPWRRRRPHAPPRTPARTLVFAQAALEGLDEALSPYQARQHEGVAYLLGLTTGQTTVVLAAARVSAVTTVGSFEVTSIEMAKIVRAATDRRLQVVGQVHTHPTLAFHSSGDEAGARIRYNGYVSVVLPEYGRGLPALDGAACFMFDRESGFVALPGTTVLIQGGLI